MLTILTQTRKYPHKNLLCGLTNAASVVSVNTAHFLVKKIFIKGVIQIKCRIISLSKRSNLRSLDFLRSNHKQEVMVRVTGSGF